MHYYTILSKFLNTSTSMFKKIFTLCVFFVAYFYSATSEDDNIFSKFHQNDYHVKNWRSISTDFNKEFFSEFSIRTFRYNRTIRAVNFTLEPLIDIGEHDIKGFSQAYKRYGTRYVEFPIFMNLEPCDFLKYNVIGLGAFTSGQFGCPFSKGVRQQFSNFIPDFSYLPPLIPDGEYILKFNFSINKEFCCSSELLGTVYRPVNNYKNSYNL